MKKILSALLVYALIFLALSLGAVLFVWFSSLKWTSEGKMIFFVVVSMIALFETNFYIIWFEENKSKNNN